MRQMLFKPVTYAEMDDAARRCRRKRKTTQPMSMCAVGGKRISIPYAPQNRTKDRAALPYDSHVEDSHAAFRRDTTQKDSSGSEANGSPAVRVPVTSLSLHRRS